MRRRRRLNPLFTFCIVLLLLLSVPGESTARINRSKTVFQSNVIIFDYLLHTTTKLVRLYILNQQHSDVYRCMKAAIKDLFWILHAICQHNKPKHTVANH